jgi:hypothetical protein
MFAISAIQTFTFIIIGNSILGIDGMNMAYWLVLFSTACFANMLGLNISASFNSAVTIYILIPFLVIPQLLLSGVIVKFDKLNPTITLQDKVPVVGEVMTSRWAYEALAVHQFKDNKFEKQFYKLDKELKVVEFKKNFWLAKLREKLSSSQNYLKDESKKEEIVNNFELLRNEISKEIKNNTKIKFSDVDKLYIDKVNETVFTNAKNYFLELNNHYLQLYKNANNSRDKLASKLNKDKEARDLFIEMKDRYTNDALSDFVKDKNEMNKIIELDNHLIQKADPIYLSPEDFRAHFYAPEKKIFGTYIDTFWVNIAVIWLMSIVLSITLYFDVLKNLIDGLEKVFEKFKK